MTWWKQSGQGKVLQADVWPQPGFVGQCVHAEALRSDVCAQPCLVGQGACAEALWRTCAARPRNKDLSLTYVKNPFFQLLN